MNLSRSLVLFVVAQVIAIAIGASWWSSLTASKKRFFKHIGKQLPWLPFRYFA